MSMLLIDVIDGCVAGCEEGAGGEWPREDTGPVPQRLPSPLWQGCYNHGQYLAAVP